MSDSVLSTAKGLGVTKTGQFDFDKTGYIQVLNRFQSDGIDYLWDLETQSQNLFYVGEFVEAGESAQNYRRPFWNACYRIKSLTLSGPSFTYKMSPITKIPNLESVNYPQEVTIEWIEDVYHSVQKYHSDWMSRWYNRQYDVLRCGLQGKFRRCTVIAFHYVNGREANDYNIIEVPEVQPIFALQIGGMCPTNMGDFKFDYGADQNDQPVSIKYNIARAAIYYNQDLAANAATKDLIWQDGIPPSATYDYAKVWSPTNFEQDQGRETGNDQELEKLRTVKQVTSYIVDEASVG